MTQTTQWTHPLSNVDHKTGLATSRNGPKKQSAAPADSKHKPREPNGATSPTHVVTLRWYKIIFCRNTVNSWWCNDRVPTGKMGRHFPVREKSGNFEQIGKVRENHTKYWKTAEIWAKYYLIFLVIFKWTVYYLLKWIKFSVRKKKQNIEKILEKWQKILEKSGNFVSPEKWEPWMNRYCRWFMCRILLHYFLGINLKHVKI